MAVIKKKIWLEYFEAVKSGRKKFEFRLADFDVAEGDTLILEEWDPKMKKYTGRELTKKITYLIHFKPNDDRFGQRESLQKHGFYILSLE